MPRDPYDVLGVSKNPTRADVIFAHWNVIKANEGHPDVQAQANKALAEIIKTHDFQNAFSTATSYQPMQHTAPAKAASLDFTDLGEALLARVWHPSLSGSCKPFIPQYIS